MSPLWFIIDDGTGSPGSDMAIAFSAVQRHVYDSLVMQRQASGIGFQSGFHWWPVHLLLC